MKELPKPVRDFSTYLRVQLNRSPKTIAQYEQDLELFFRYIKAFRSGAETIGEDFDEIIISDIDVDYIGGITSEEIYEYFAYTANVRMNKARARARKLSALKSFYKYLTVKTRRLENNPVKDWESPTIKQSLPKYLTVEESVSLLEAVQSDTESKSRIRDFAILTLFLNCGMRLAELVGINLSDMDRDLRSLRVIGKGSKERIVYLNDACRDALRAYLAERALDVEIKDKNALFISRLHKRVGRQTVQTMVYKYLKAAGLEYKRYSVHKLRHTAATLMYQTGKVDVRVLKDILGHEQLNTTQIYTHVSDKNMEEAVRNNPLANINARSLSDKSKKEDEDE